MKEFAKNNNSQVSECYIHFKHENYNAVKLFLNDLGDRFEVTRMCPVGNIQFFFTFSASFKAKKIFISSEYQKLYQEQ
jgi:hypothetical protein